MMLKKVVISISILLSTCQVNAQNLFRLEADSSYFRKDYFLQYIFQTDQSNFKDRIIPRNKSYKSTLNFNLDFLEDYEYKSYEISQYYVFHGNNIIPHYIKNRYPITPDITRRKIEIVREKK